MDKSKKILLSILIIIIAIFITIIILKNNNKNKKYDELDKQYQEFINETKNPAAIVNGTKPEPIQFETIYLTVKKCLNKFFEYCDKNNFDAIKAILDSEYKDSDEIATENYKEVNDYIIEDMYALNGSNYYTFYVKGYSKNKELYVIINLDFKNKTFSIMPSDKNIYEKQINTIINGRTGKEKEIEKNEFNKYQSVVMKEEKIAESYLIDFKEKLISNPRFVYDNILDNEYKQKNFSRYDDFEKFVKNNNDKIKNIEFYDYSIERDGRKRTYSCTDINNNTYIFFVTSAMKYTLVLKDNFIL